MTIPNESPVHPGSGKRWLRWLLVALLVLVAVPATAVLVFQKVSDGPYGMLAGGAFRSGEVVDPLSVDYTSMAGDPTELLLVGPGTSRTLGYFMHEGDVYISCDLGFMWNRFDGMRRNILGLIYVFKDWHEDALVDGRAELRIAGKRYAGYLHLVEDPDTDAALRAQLEDLARQWFAEDIGPVPPAPNGILVFRFEPGGSA